MAAVQVYTGQDCPWRAASHTFWLSLLSYDIAGSGEVQYVVARNANSATRVGSLLIAAKIVTVIQDGAPADTNGDGLPDSWQLFCFMDANSPDAAPGLDFDGDGVTNLDEYLAGTGPTDDTSALRITSFQPVPDNGWFELEFSTVLEHYYQVKRTENLLQPAWRGYTNAVFGTGASLPIIGPVSTNVPQQFYRVRQVY